MRKLKELKKKRRKNAHTDMSKATFNTSNCSHTNFPPQIAKSPVPLCSGMYLPKKHQSIFTDTEERNTEIKSYKNLIVTSFCFFWQSKNPFSVRSLVRIIIVPPHMQFSITFSMRQNANLWPTCGDPVIECLPLLSSERILLASSLAMREFHVFYFLLRIGNCFSFINLSTEG